MTKEEFLNLIDNGKVNIKIPFTPLSELEKLFKECGFESLPGYETNGWQTDFWLPFKYLNGSLWTLSGSLWDGGFIMDLIDNNE